MTGEMTGKTRDDGAAAPRPAGGGDGSCDPPTGSADGCACRSGGTRAQGVCGRQGRGRGGAAAVARHRPLGSASCAVAAGTAGPAAAWGCR